MNRTQLTLAGILVAQLLLIVLVRSPFSSAHGPTEARLMFPDAVGLEASRLELLGPDDAGLTLVSREGSWVLEESGYPADATKIEQLITQLSEIEVRRPVVASDRYHEAFEITDDAFRGRLRLYGGDSDPAVDLLLGSAPNYQVTHARAAGDDAVYELTGIAPYDISPEPRSWADKQLVDVPATEVVTIVVENGAGLFELSRGEAGWTVVRPADRAGTVVAAAEVDNLVRGAGDLRIDSPVGPRDDAAHGYLNPAVVVTLIGSSGDTTVIRVGDEIPDDDGRRYVSRDGFEFSASVWESTVKPWIEQSLEALLDDGDGEEAPSS